MVRRKHLPQGEPKKSRHLAISQRQAQTLLRAAERENAIVEVETGSSIYRLIPKCLVKDSQQGGRTRSSETFASMDEYRAWKERTVADQD